MSGRPSNKEIREVISFVRGELSRYQELLRDYKSYAEEVRKDEWPFFDLPHPNGSRRKIGSQAFRRLQNLSRKIVSNDPRLAGRMENETFFKLFSREVSAQIFSDVCIDERQLVEFCITSALQECIAPRIHFVPCVLPNYSGISKFSIGPVRFFKKDDFFSGKICGDFIDYYGDLERAKEFYQRQNWVACVAIDGFDKKKAQERAFLFVRLAIASIKVKLDQGLAQWLGTERQSFPNLRNYSFVSESTNLEMGKVALGWGHKYVLNSGNKSVEHLRSESSRAWFFLVGAFLDRIIGIPDWSFLESKIVTALIWSDIGGSPVSNAERIVAFSNCLEALFVTHENGKKSQLVERSRLFLEYAGWRPDYNSRVSNFYSKRCDIVHGEEMPLRPELREFAEVGKYFSDVCVEGFVNFAYWLLMKHRDEGTKQHLRPFNGRSSFDKAMREELPIFFERLSSPLHPTPPAPTFPRHPRET
ncbi:hypothetical protein C8J30_11846 [Rhodobacter viridis]|uniref:Uncharacterized protein n=1 Tax=Rhodobacter viridis TaxID=1054202 RepID=A0A318TUB8_9RHOB|nr:hypothetical protein C8J30_11846 [Rhodobacter viridis]